LLSFDSGQRYVLVCRILVGNKTDTAVRQVPTERGARLAREWGVPFMEVSARLQDEAVGAAFGELVRFARNPSSYRV
jgi:hypothetical protein